MELINGGLTVFLLLAISSLFSSANAICVPRNSSIIPATLSSLQSQPQSPPQAPPQSPQQAPPQSPPQAPPQSPPQTPPQAPSQAPTNSAPAPMASEEASEEASTNSTPAPTTSEEASEEESTNSTPASTESEEASEEASTNSTPASAESEEASESKESGLGIQNLDTSLVSSVASTVKTELVEICDVTSNPQLCKSSISSHMEGSTIDPKSALKTEIEESIKEVQKAIATLNSLTKDSAASHAEVECYDTCLENFDMAVEDLKAGLESIDAGDTGRMESVLTAVLTDLMTCDDTFAEMGVDSPLDNLSTKMNKFASNCLAISKLLL